MIISPKKKFIGETRELLGIQGGGATVSLVGLTITTDPSVFNPEIFFSSQWFAEHVAQLTKNESILIEVGSGSGIVSIKSAKNNPDLQVYATDIVEKARDLTELNAAQNDVSGRMHAYIGDVLDSIPADIHADSIFWSMPFGYLEPAEKLSDRDVLAFDPGYRAIRKFFETARGHLKEHGRLLIGFSSDIGHLDLLKQIAEENNFSLKLLEQTKGIEKDSVSMEIWGARPI